MVIFTLDDERGPGTSGSSGRFIRINQLPLDKPQKPKFSSGHMFLFWHKGSNFTILIVQIILSFNVIVQL